MTDVDEAQLVDAAKAGDASALSDLLDAWQHRLFNVCLRMLTHRDDAAEAAQETMLKVVQHIGNFDGRSKVGTWMIRIAMNESISTLRKRKRRYTESLDAGSDGSQASALRKQVVDQREPSPELSVQTSEELAHLQTALARIDEDYRSVLILRDIEQMDYQQIADVLDAPLGTVKSRLFRARLALRQQMLKQIERPHEPQAHRAAK